MKISEISLEGSKESEIVKEKSQPENKKEKGFKETFKKIKRVFTHRIFLISLAAILFLVVFFGFSLFFPLQNICQQSTKLKEKARELKLASEEKNFTLLKEKLNETGQLLGETEAVYKQLSWLRFVPKIKNYYFDGERAFSAGKEALEAGIMVIEALDPYQDFLGLAERVEGGGEKTTEDRIEFLLEGIGSLAPKLTLLEEKINKIQELIEPIDPSHYPKEFKGIVVKDNLIKAKKLLAEGATFFKEGKPLLEKADFLLGKDSPRKYLILFQNDGELRPTGGFWTAYGILKVDKGKITPLVSEDIYDLDNRFNSRIEAPPPIKNYLKNVFYWHLRDMNLSPDFKVSLEQFWPYYQKVALEKEVDGIIAVDTNVLVGLLEVLGKIGVPGWGNFSAEADPRCFGCPQVVYQLEMLADRPVPTMRTARKGFLAPIMHSILANAMGAPREKIAPLAKVVWKNISDKHILFYFFDENLQKGAEKLKFAGRLIAAPSDYFHLNDANFGGAKSNLFISQEVKHEYQRLDGKIKKKVTVKYQNNAPASDCNLERGNLCLNGLYRNWFRFFLPKGSRLVKLTGSEVEVKIYDELEKTVFEGFFGDKLPLYPKGISKTTVEYELPFNNQDSLDLLIQNQPGKDAVKHEIWVEGKKQEEIMVSGDINVTINF